VGSFSLYGGKGIISGTGRKRRVVQKDSQGPMGALARGSLASQRKKEGGRGKVGGLREVGRGQIEENSKKRNRNFPVSGY